MISFKDFVAEAKQVGTLYHFTTPLSLDRMLFSKAIDNFGIPQQSLVSGLNDYISTTRNYNLSRDMQHKMRRGDFTIDKGYSVRISLDGDKISQQHKITPIRGLMGDSPNVHDLNRKDRVSRHSQEREEIIRADWLPLKQYVKRIDFVHHDNLHNDVHQKITNELDRLGIVHSIGRKWEKHDMMNERFDTEDEDSFVIIER